jgi:NADH/NAD ratio-sensing transcriptional regulator Rex
MQNLFNLNEDIRQFDAVIIYGAGAAGQGMLLRLLQENVKVHCFADSDPEKCGTYILNIPVTHIDELADLRETAAMIVLSGYAFPVAKELEKRGWKHLFFDYGNDYGIVHLEREY